MSPFSDKIVYLRRQYCPRTSYATAGTAASTIFFVIHDRDEPATEVSGKLFQELVDTKEFEDRVNFDSFEECAAVIQLHVVLLFNPHPSEVMSLQSMLLENRSKLFFAYSTNPAGKCSDNFKTKVRSNSITISEICMEDGVLTAFYMDHNAVLPSSSKVGFNGQPSVQSKNQFQYLWSLSNLTGLALTSRRESKLRVLQRLADHAGYDGSKVKLEDWDKRIQDALQKGCNDWQIYSMIRKVNTGKSLEEDLHGEGVLTPHKSQVQPSSHDNTAGGEADGRAEHLVNISTLCLPLAFQVNPKKYIKTMLDYGCAEGAITAEIGRKLSLDSSAIYGADVRAITANNGYTFIQLPPESADADVEVLPSIADGSLDLINAAMVFHHVTHVDKVLQELRRKLSDNGVLLIREHDCHDEAMAVMLDITHGLYSLSWSQPVEWPGFIKEYEAFYRNRQNWDILLHKLGFIRFIEENNKTAVSQYNAAEMSVFNEKKQKFPNVIRAYYAVYKKNLDVTEERSSAKRSRDESNQDNISIDARRKKVRFMNESEGSVRYLLIESKTNPGKFYLFDNETKSSQWI